MVSQAVKTAASVREKAVGAFDGLIPIFSDVELFLGTFPGDVRIRRASVDLTVTTLDAIERAIGFFISNECEFRPLGLQAPGKADVSYRRYSSKGWQGPAQRGRLREAHGGEPRHDPHEELKSHEGSRKVSHS